MLMGKCIIKCVYVPTGGLLPAQGTKWEHGGGVWVHLGIKHFAFADTLREGGNGVRAALGPPVYLREGTGNTIGGSHGAGHRV